MSYVALAHDALSVGLGALATVALFASFPAVANQTKQARVDYSDLDLTGRTGQDSLDRRIRGAVKQVCGPTATTADIFVKHRNCKRAAFASARHQMQIAVAKAGARKALATSLAYASRRAGMH